MIGKNGVVLLSPEEANAPAVARPPAAGASFPASWAGTWRGSVSTSAPGREPEATPMEIEIAPTERPDRWAFRIRHGDEPVRQVLLARDSAAGAFSIDDGSGVVLPATWLDGELQSAFALDGKLFVARHRVEGDALRFDLVGVGSHPAPAAESGGGSVAPYSVYHLQRAVLRRSAR